MSDADQPERRTVRFIGHVQGVGFRYTAQAIARNFQVVGYVRNLPDGSVEMVAEGSPREIEALVQAIRDQMRDFIRDVKQSTQPATSEFRDFSIRH